jgi:N-methylhydantoinase A
MCGYRVGIDIGGTFTDLVALDERTGRLTNIKLSSTPGSPADGVISALERFLEDKEPANVAVLSHATTIAVNALLGQTGLELPRTGLVTTAGFRDVLEIGRQRRHELYDLFIERPKTLVPRKYRYEVNERMNYNGRVIGKLDPVNVRRVARRLKRDRIRAVAIGLLYSYRNPRHEKEVTRILRAECPDVLVTASHEIAPEHREYERISTTVVNAVLMPIVSKYLDDLSERIRAFGISAPLSVMQSSGGIAPKEIATGQPVRIVESGPAAGVIAATYYGKLLGLGNIMSLDMGGTTAKAGAIRDGVPQVVSEYEVGGKIHSGRIVKGSGYPVRFPFIDLAEASAGGGTIAWVDEGGALKVGPVSAGADPGPACYGKGQMRP